MKMRRKDFLIRLWVYLSGIFVISLIIFIFGYIFLKGYKVINWRFITDVPRGMILGTEGGIAPAIIGSFLSTGIACAVSSFFALFTSIYLVFYEKNEKRKKFIQLVIKCISGIPSIVFGLFGYSMFTLYFSFGRSVLSGGLTLAVMIFPVIEIKTEKVFSETDRNIINASYSLGVSKIYTVFKIIIPMCRENIIYAVSLAYGYAMGAAAPIMFCMAVINSPVSFDISKPSMTLSYHLYILMTQGISTEMAYGTAFVLLFVILAVTVFCQILAGKRK